MGTNYYLKTAPCECCGLYDERNTMHIGKIKEDNSSQ